MTTGPDHPDRREMERLWSSPPDETQIDRLRECITDWVWTRSGSNRWHCAPHGEERLERKSGRDLRREPSSKHRVERYGYDRDGRLVIAEALFHGEVGRVLATSPFRDGRLRWEWYERLLNVLTYCVSCDGRASYSHEYRGPGGTYTTESYEYDDDGRLVVVAFRREGYPWDPGSSAADQARGVERLHYDDDGQLVAVVEEYESGQPPMTRFARVKESWDDILPKLTAALEAAFADAIRSSRPDERVVWAALSYGEGEPESVPPALQLCSEDRWQEIRDAFGDDRLAFNPAEWREPEAKVVGDGEAGLLIGKAKALIAQDRAPRNAVRDLAVALASRLDEQELGSQRRNPCRLRVFAVDFELEDLERNAPDVLKRGT